MTVIYCLVSLALGLAVGIHLGRCIREDPEPWWHEYGGRAKDTPADHDEV